MFRRRGSGAPAATGSGRRRADTGWRVLVVAPLAAVVVGLAVVATTMPGGAVTPSPTIVASDSPAQPTERGYLATPEEVHQRGVLAAQGVEPFDEALSDLREWADENVNIAPGPVQPLVVQGTDNVLVDDTSRAYGLGLAYAVTGDERYAEAARRTILGWVEKTHATADTCTDNGGCHTSLIIGRVGAGFAFGADMIADSGAWSAADRGNLQDWYKTVLLPAASERINNWGDAGTFLRVVATDYIGDDKGFSAALDKWRSLVDLIEPNGRIPEEARRGSAGISYTQEALQYKIAVARIAERRGIDLWDYVGKGGGTLRAAMDRLAYYWSRPQEWPDYPRPDVPSAGPVWEIAYAHWQEPSWIPMVLDTRPYGDRGHSAIRWTTLTNGIPIDPELAAASGSPSVAPPASPSESAADSPPAATGPTVAGLTLRLGSPLGTRIPITIRWKDGSAGTRFRIERSTDGVKWKRIALGSDGHSAPDDISTGTHYTYRVRATRGAETGPWRTLDRVRALRIEPSRRTVDPRGSWEVVPFGDYSKGAAYSTDAAGSSITWRGSAGAVAIVGPVGPTRGRLTLEVDGDREATVDLYSATYHARRDLASARFSPDDHLIRITAGSSGGRRTVAVDDFVVVDWTVSAEQAP